MSKRDFKITRDEDQLYEVKVVDSYGNEYQNYFDHAYQANDWVYYIWENEDWFEKSDSMTLLSDAIQECVIRDEKMGREPLLD